MAVYVISYDLRAPGRNYEGLYTELHRIDAVRALESVWFLSVNQGAIALREALLSYMDKNDGLMVIEITNDADWAIARVSAVSTNWLLRNRP